MQIQTEKSVEDWYNRIGVRAPVNLESICADMNVIIHRAPVPGVALCESKIIVLDSRLNSIQSREQLAHEMAHILLHCGGQWYQNRIYIQQQEWQARNLGLILLAPIHLLREEIGPGDSIYTLLPFLAEKFQISASSLKFRLNILAGALTLAM
ncbi:ImmA/IrrE family metallo-endopeptidase [Alicyclobacillus acidoterrestris]|uniref:ImmA/IrrE family metallo-endopeptidase n=1 Tax=Alicyclobacillus acidoterrestris (strain ATCC 49025 / DSM 3922 / CIP 106132 / NCIMB 13137 / GD3B) TaxID=1356854 RepID=T0CP68_ALIAG|nr:ImmA/IrrE family metallo-endopeptidase [Alicyclobacillus acidoterrestris]EPZ41272.1 hypothetical protein N007_01925 [Alicyclobacillus acidoterrestris ATCC 49025]UNO49016.1 ImmA/IrrE family metallo-endopeptidase [Alicyclobacillus acidoterrestris]